jgi:hypothetical protein
MSRVKILFVMHNQGFVPYYESTLRVLAERGHRVHLAFNQPFKPDEHPFADMLVTTVPGISYSLAPARGDSWSALATAVRSAMDYLRYLHPRYKHAHKLRHRALVWPLHAPMRLVSRSPLGTPRGIAWMTRLLKLIERAIPDSRQIKDFIRCQEPDLLLVTPLVETASKQVDYVKGARALGIRAALCVASWDNLTSKGMIRVEPDAVMVWNEIQRREAVELHGVPASKVVVTGAQLFDEWFDRQPTTSRQEFCRQVGLPADRPFVLYLCSSPLIAGREVPFVGSWIDQVQASDCQQLREVGILIRPHPQNTEQWLDADFSSRPNVTIWPRRVANRLDPLDKSAFFDSIYHSAAVVGINTSALIEAAIIGRSVFTVLAPEFRETQEDMLQFRYLRHHSHGLLNVAGSFHEHLAQLGEAVVGGRRPSKKERRFLESFVRPFGLAVPCTPILADAIEQAAGASMAVSPPVWSYPIRCLLYPVALLMNSAWLSTRERVSGAARS